MEYNKMIIAGISTLLMTGTAFIAWKKSVKYRTKYKSNFRDWGRNRIANMYYKSLDERDIAWG